MIGRRGFLAATAGVCAAPALGWANVASPMMLTAREARAQIAPEGYATTPVWAFDGQIPGPELRVAQGAELALRVQNDLPEPTAVHWHGIRIDNAMDGVPGLTQRHIAPGSTFDYAFTLPDAGTYWYHSHNRSMEQVERGLAGALIVEEADAPDVDDDIVLLIDDWKLDPETVELMAFDNFHDLSHAGRLGNVTTVNGQFSWTGTVQRGARVRLRLINAANARVLRLALRGARGWVVALDGMPLVQPQEIDDLLVLAPAQRVDVIADVSTEPDLTLDLITFERQGSFSIARFQPTEPALLRKRPAPVPLPANPVPAPENPAAAPLTTVRMQGGAMRWLSEAEYDGRIRDGRSLAEDGKYWALSGVVDLPDLPVIDARLGDTHRIAFVNDTRFEHGMHMHGHHFYVLEADGTLGPLRDTVLLAPGETRQVVFVADNPGDWLLHCHMLGHSHAGMKTWFRVS